MAQLGAFHRHYQHHGEDAAGVAVVPPAEQYESGFGRALNVDGSKEWRLRMRNLFCTIAPSDIALCIFHRVEYDQKRLAWFVQKMQPCLRNQPSNVRAKTSAQENRPPLRRANLCEKNFIISARENMARGPRGKP